MSDHVLELKGDWQT